MAAPSTWAARCASAPPGQQPAANFSQAAAEWPQQSRGAWSACCHRMPSHQPPPPGCPLLTCHSQGGRRHSPLPNRAPGGKRAAQASSRAISYTATLPMCCLITSPATPLACTCPCPHATQTALNGPQCSHRLPAFALPLPLPPPLPLSLPAARRPSKPLLTVCLPCLSLWLPCWRC